MLVSFAKDIRCSNPGKTDGRLSVSHSPLAAQRYQSFTASLRLSARVEPFYVCMEKWRYKAAFVIQLRQESDPKAGRFEGRVEHIESYKATRFHSLDELLGFIASVLPEDGNPEDQ